VEPHRGPGTLRYPEFPGLTDREREAAMAMIEINTVQYRNLYTVVHFEKHLATIVPANVLVLFFLLGVPTSVLAGWASNDAGTVLYAVLQWIVATVNRHHDEAVRPLQKSFCPEEYDLDSEESTLKKFESKLAERGVDAVAQYRAAVLKQEEALVASTQELPLVVLRPRWELHAEGGFLRFPRTTRDSILVFPAGGNRPDAVVAPHLFLRAVRNQGDDEEEIIDLESELQRCSLLKEVEDDRFLRAAVALWSGAFDDDMSSSTDSSTTKPYVLIDPQGSVVGSGFDDESRRRLLPEVSEAGSEPTLLRFVLTTRADAIPVRLPAGGPVIAVQRDVLDSHRELDVERAKWWDGRKLARRRPVFSPDGGTDAAAAASAWTRFVRDRVRGASASSSCSSRPASPPSTRRRPASIAPNGDTAFLFPSSTPLYRSEGARHCDMWGRLYLCR
jgi:hypothetical protein